MCLSDSPNQYFVTCLGWIVMKIVKLTQTVLFLTLVTGCANVEQGAYTGANSQQGNINLSQRVNDSANQVELDYLKAKDNNYSYYAPNTWLSIENDLVRMRQLVNRFDPHDQGFFGGPSEETVLSSIAEVSNELIKAQETKHEVITFLAQPLADIEYLTPKIDTVWQSDFNKINRNLSKLINNIEKKYAVSRQENDRDKLQRKIQDLEINIVTAEYYSPLEKQFDQLNKQLIPQSYNHVLQGLRELNNVIMTTPRDSTALIKVTNMVTNRIQSAEHITTDVTWINNLNKRQREKIVLHYRATLESLGLKFLDQDLSNLSYKAQVKTFELALSAKLDEYAASSATAVIAEHIEGQITDTTVDASPEDTPVETTQVSVNQ